MSRRRPRFDCFVYFEDQFKRIRTGRRGVNVVKEAGKWVTILVDNRKRVRMKRSAWDALPKT